MIEQPYPYNVLIPKTHYFFESIGEKNVFKVVQFDLIEGNLWNLGFGDLNNGEIDDSVITNNQDARKVIRTVNLNKSWILAAIHQNKYAKYLN